MRRRWKIAGTILLLGVAILAVPVVLLLVAPMVYSGLVENAVRSTVGLDLTYRDMHVAFFPVRVSVAGLELENPDPAFEAPILVAEEVWLVARPGDYLTGAPTWWQGAASSVNVRLEQDAQGNSNWQLQRGPEPAEQSGAGRWLDFSTVEVNDLQVVRVAPRRHRFDIDRLALQRFADESVQIDVDGRYGDQPLQASGTLALPSSEQAREVSFHAVVFGGTLSVDGRVGHDGITPGRAEVDGDFDDLSALGALLGEDLSGLEPIDLAGTVTAPEPGRWQVSARGSIAGKPLELTSAITASQQRYDLNELDLSYGGTSLRASGHADLAERRMQGKLNGKRLVLHELLPAEGEATSQPSSASSDSTREPVLVVPEPFSRWRMDVAADLEEIIYRDVVIHGLAGDFSGDRDSLSFSGGIQGLQSSREDAQSPWRLVKPLSLEGIVRLPRDDPAAVASFEATLSTPGIDAQVNTVLPAAASGQPRFGVRVEVSELAALEGIPVDQATYDDVLPVRLDLEAEGGGSVWNLELKGAAVAGTELYGHLVIDPTATPVNVRGELRSPEIDLNTIPTTTFADDGKSAGEDEAAPASTTDDAQSGDFISDQPLSWAWLDAAAVSVDARVDRLAFNQTTFRDVRTHLRLRNSELRVEPISANLTRGGVRGHARVGRLEQGAEVDVRLVVSQLVPADLGLRDQGLIDGGATDLVVDLAASGRSLQDLAGSLSGEAALEIQRATLRNDLFSMVGSDVLVQTFYLINPFAKQDDQTDLECAAAHVVAERGKLTSPNRLVIETSKVVIRAGGTVNLREETLQLDFMPSPRKGLGLSLGGLADLVRVGGTLSNPQPEVNPAGVLKSGAKIGAAIATGGVSLLAQGLFARARNAGTRCGSIFEEQTDVPSAIRVDESNGASSGGEEGQSGAERNGRE